MKSGILVLLLMVLLISPLTATQSFISFGIKHNTEIKFIDLEEVITQNIRCNENQTVLAVGLSMDRRLVEEVVESKPLIIYRTVRYQTNSVRRLEMGNLKSHAIELIARDIPGIKLNLDKTNYIRADTYDVSLDILSEYCISDLTGKKLKEGLIMAYI